MYVSATQFLDCTERIVHLCSLQEYAGDDPTNLFLEEREAQLRQAADEKRRQQLAVPGIINPHDRPDEMQE